MHDQVRRELRDSGMTLPEVLIAVTMMAVIATVLSTAIVVTLRQQQNTEGRLAFAAAEQNIDLWLPGDLSSAAMVRNDNPQWSPCGTATCAGISIPSGSVALQLSWTSQEVGGPIIETNVAYHFAPVGDGTHELVRIVCETPEGGGPTCTSNTILRNIEAPAGWAPPDPVPTSVIKVTVPANLDGSELTAEQLARNTRRVTVTIGGQVYGGAGGEVNLIAGGASRGELPARGAYAMPSLVEPRSRCGGRMTLLVDESTSLGSAVDTVRDAVVDFATMLVGTPVELQVIPFSDKARVIGDWGKWWDMSDPSEVSALVSAASSPSSSERIGKGGWTNWEDAWFHAFYNLDGTPADNPPATVVFFTDGLPTRDRFYSSSNRSDTGLPTALPPAPNGSWGHTTSGGNNTYIWPGTPSGQNNISNSFSMVAFLRAERLVAGFREDTRMIGVAAGPSVVNASNFVTDWDANGGQWQRHSYTSSSRPWRQGSSNRTSVQYFGQAATSNYSINPNGWTDVTFSSVPSVNDEGASGNYYYQLKGVRTPHSTIVGRLIAGPESQIRPFVIGGDGTIDNLDEGNLYTSGDFDQLRDVLKQVALGDCGGTVNIQTRAGSATGTPVNTTFQYRKAAVFIPAGSSGTAVAGPDETATINTINVTNSVSRTATFDQRVSDGTARVVEIVPEGVANIMTASFNSWQCRAGPDPITPELVPLVEDGVEVDGWKGIRVRVEANQAVSCVLVVN